MIGTARPLKVRGMARIAVRRHRLKLAIGRAFVARVTIGGRVRPGQRKAIVVLLHLLDRNRPSLYCVALLAVGAELPFVNIGVAILAALPHIREHRLHVTLAAGHCLMHAAQGISRLIVVELRNGTDGRPGTCRVAVLAGNVQIAVRTMRTSPRLR
jgi:hypothetical protein